MNLLAFVNEVKLELKKVTWPNRSEVMRMTGIVILVSILVGFYIGILDIIFAKILEMVVQ